QMEGKRLGLLNDLVPRADLIAVLLNPTNPFFENQLKDQPLLRKSVEGCSAAAWPLAVIAQQSGKVYRIGYINAGANSAPHLLNAFHDAMRALGWMEGKNIVYEDRYAENRLERLSELVAELVRLEVDVIVTGGTLAPLAAKQATATIPIVMTAAGDPFGSRPLASLRPPRRDPPLAPPPRPPP